MTDQPRWLDTLGASEYLRGVHGLTISAKTLTQWRWRGTGPGCEFFRAKPVYKSAALDAWVADNIGDRNPLIDARARTRARREAEEAAAAQMASATKVPPAKQIAAREFNRKRKLAEAGAKAPAP